MAETRLAAPANNAVEALREFALNDSPRTNRHEVYAAMSVFAVACLERGLTQTAADTLAYLLQDPGVIATVRREAVEIFDELESRICPRVILDARAFAEGMDLLSMLEYLLDVIEPETT